MFKTAHQKMRDERDKQEAIHYTLRYGEKAEDILLERAADIKIGKRDRAHWRRIAKFIQRLTPAD